MHNYFVIWMGMQQGCMEKFGDDRRQYTANNEFGVLHANDRAVPTLDCAVWPPYLQTQFNVESHYQTWTKTLTHTGIRKTVSA
jgi:hypothetical protein